MSDKRNYSAEVAALYAENPAWRYGQAAFNALPPTIAEKVVGTWRDPFHQTNRAEVDAFILSIEIEMERGDHA